MRRTRRLWWKNKPAQCLRYWRRIQSDSLGNFPLRAKDRCTGVVATRKESATVKRNHARGLEHALNVSGVIGESLCAKTFNGSRFRIFLQEGVEILPCSQAGVQFLDPLLFCGEPLVEIPPNRKALSNHRRESVLVLQIHGSSWPTQHQLLDVLLTDQRHHAAENGFEPLRFDHRAHDDRKFLPCDAIRFLFTAS